MNARIAIPLPLLIALSAGAFSFGCTPRKHVDTRNEPGYMRDRSAPASTVDAYRGPKRRIAVVDFQNKTPYGKRELGDSATDIIITELQKTGQFIIVEREKIQALMDEQRFSNSEAAEPATAAKLGRMLGASAIVTGSVSQFGQRVEGVDTIVYQRKTQVAEATVDIRIVDVESGEILVADSGRGTGEQTIKGSMGLGGRSTYDTSLASEALRAAIFKFTKNIVDRMGTMAWSARVAQVDAGRIYIDAGKGTGLPLGSELEVLRPGKEIISPTTGRSMGQTTTLVGRVKVIEYFGDDGAVAESLDGEAAPMDIVQMPTR